ncbi:class I SAM-dependent methyltransferase [Glaciecola sp. 1036]|uniref:class I SAM-dependent methyltransferase n=1 Tax=Alteromonadaceae TaxID=72275 RepID=UPI003D053927
MQPNEIGLAYDQLTPLFNSSDFNRSYGIEQHKRALKFVKNPASAFDVGCGCSGRIFDLLIEHGLTAKGIDVSEQMVALAKERHPTIDIICGDICEYSFTEQYDFITAWDSIWHIPLASQQAVMDKLVNALAPAGVLLFSFGGTENADKHVNTAMGPAMYYSTLGTNGYIELLLSKGMQLKHLEFDQFPERHGYLIAQKPE